MPRRHRNASPRYEQLGGFSEDAAARLRYELNWNREALGKPEAPDPGRSEASTAPRSGLIRDGRAAGAHDNARC